MSASADVILPSTLILAVPIVPEYTSLTTVASGINVNLPVESSKPKNPVLDAVPVCQPNSIPLSLLSSD